MGLGLLGRGVGDAVFLAQCGARLTVTDLKTEKELAPSLKKLKQFKNIQFVLGRHRVSDFQKADLVIKSAGVPLDSSYIKEAKKHGVPITMSTALFAKLIPEDVTLIGVTGTRGKTTVAHLTYEILKSDKHRVFLGGNVRGVSTLALLKKIKPKDYVVLELDSWQLQGFGDERISPHIAVFTNFLEDHMNYYRGSMKQYWKDKEHIFTNQKERDVIFAGKDIASRIRKNTQRKGKLIIVDAIPKNWKLKMPGEHNRANAAFAVAIARQVGVPQQIIKKTVESFRGVPGRLEYLRTIRGVKIYNDTTATMPEATIAALRALQPTRLASQAERATHNLQPTTILIMGGADKNLNMSALLKEIPKYCKKVLLLPGTGSEKIKNQISKIKITTQNVKSLREAVELAMSEAKRGDIILFSPAFASFGLFKNEFDRGEQFDKLIDNAGQVRPSRLPSPNADYVV